MLPAGAGPPPAWGPLLGAGKVRVHPRPTREEVLEAVARALRYPAALLTPADPGRVAALLEARRGRRILFAHGQFSGPGTWVVG